jgi:hypothetical protein
MLMPTGQGAVVFGFVERGIIKAAGRPDAIRYYALGREPWMLRPAPGASGLPLTLKGVEVDVRAAFAPAPGWDTQPVGTLYYITADNRVCMSRALALQVCDSYGPRPRVVPLSRVAEVVGAASRPSQRRRAPNR